MDLDLTDEQKMIRDMARNFADEVIAPRSGEMESTGAYPYDIIAQMADLGMMGIPFPEEYGGSGGDWVGHHVCVEEISRADITLGALLDVTTSVVGQELYAFGTEDQKKKWLVPIAQGKQIGAFALTEPDAGSDAAALRTHAILDGDEWVLNGSKQFITNIGLDNASVAITAAHTGKAEGRKKIISTFIVPKDAPGLTIGKRYDKMGWRASATHEMVFNDCRIPKENLLGDPRHGFAQHLAVLQTGRITIAAMAVGLAQASLDEALRHAKQRIQFGKPIFDHQVIRFKLADMAVAIEMARSLYIKASWLKDQGREHTFEACAAKLFASEMAERVAGDALQIHGGYGYMDEYPVSRLYKNAKLMQIVEGTSEVQRMIIGDVLARRGGRL
jgi:alkylation response protein AidB-like acyl-CoA dehydrogenase